MKNKSGFFIIVNYFSELSRIFESIFVCFFMMISQNNVTKKDKLANLVKKTKLKYNTNYQLSMYV